jgi:hypothetical protein
MFSLQVSVYGQYLTDFCEAPFEHKPLDVLPTWYSLLEVESKAELLKAIGRLKNSLYNVYRLILQENGK